MACGNIALVLNAHLPFVRHPDYPCFLEERWLFESLSETYLPLLRMFAKLDSEKIPWKISLALSPTLTSMLSDALLCTRYQSWLKSQIELGEKELIRNKDDPVIAPLAEMYTDLYRLNYDDFTVLYAGNILSAFAKFQREGKLDILTSGATGAFLPIYKDYPEAINAQVESAVISYRSTFGCSPTGFWLHQLGWYPGLESTLSAYGLKYTVVTTRGAFLGKAIPKNGSFSPLDCDNGFTTFVRNFPSTEAVWSSTTGYPANPLYRDFYRDIGYDLPLNYIGSYIEQNQTRTFTGFKYWSIAEENGTKKPYNVSLAFQKAREQAEDFIKQRREQAITAASYMDTEPIMVAPYDAELFGHSWFEGLEWLYNIFKIGSEQDSPAFVTLAEYKKTHSSNQVSVPEYSSWESGGYSTVWVDKNNDWIYRHTFKLVERMVDLAERFPNERGLRERILNQASREVLLAQASDWPFLMRAGKSASFARRQIEDCVTNFTRIYEMLCSNDIGTEWITKLEKRDNLFPNMNYRIWRKKH